MDHHWVATSWLSDVGLPQYSQTFQAHLVDGRVLNSLSHRDLEQFLNISDQNHQTSLLLAIQLLQIVSFDKEVSKYARPLIGSLTAGISQALFLSQPLPLSHKCCLGYLPFCVFAGSAGPAGEVRASGLGPHCLDKSQSNQVD